MAPFHWSKIPQNNSPLPLPFALHLKTPTQVDSLTINSFHYILFIYGMPPEIIDFPSSLRDPTPNIQTYPYLVLHLIKMKQKLILENFLCE